MSSFRCCLISCDKTKVQIVEINVFELGISKKNKNKIRFTQFDSLQLGALIDNKWSMKVKSN